MMRMIIRLFPQTPRTSPAIFRLTDRHRHPWGKRVTAQIPSSNTMYATHAQRNYNALKLQTTKPRFFGRSKTHGGQRMPRFFWKNTLLVLSDSYAWYLAHLTLLQASNEYVKRVLAVLAMSPDPSTIGKNCPTLTNIAAYLGPELSLKMEHLKPILTDLFPGRWPSIQDPPDKIAGKPRTVFDCVLVSARPPRHSATTGNSWGTRAVSLARIIRCLTPLARRRARAASLLTVRQRKHIHRARPPCPR